MMSPDAGVQFTRVKWLWIGINALVHAFLKKQMSLFILNNGKLEQGIFLFFYTSIGNCYWEILTKTKTA